MTHPLPQRGFTLLIAIILASVSLALALALLDVAYKQVTLALTAKQSQYAFLAADTALECALYYDQKQDLFNYTKTSGSVSCNGQAPVTVTFTQGVTPRKRTFTIPCAGGVGEYAQVTVYKASDAGTRIYANGYNTCTASDTRRIERGLKVFYGL